MSASPPGSRGAADAEEANERPVTSEEAPAPQTSLPRPRPPARAPRHQSTSPGGGDTPMLRQYAAVKARHPEALLLYRMGDFYELFHEDARVAARALNITLTARGRGTPNEAAMCGVPHHALDVYVARLVRLGHRVAICDQVERPGQGRKLLRREVTRVITPGTLADPQQLEATAPHFLASVCTQAEWAGIATIDLSTGHFRVARISSEPREIWDFLDRLSVRELIHPDGKAPPRPAAGTPVPPFSPVPDWTFGLPAATQGLTDHFGTQNLTGFGLDGLPEVVRAAGALLHYLRETQKSSLRHIDRLALHDEGEHLVLDEATRRNLEIVESLGGDRGNTLLAIMDETVTAPGARLLRDWLLHPLKVAESIDRRLRAVSDLLEDSARRQRLRRELRGIHDLERLLGRAALGTANPRDLIMLRDSLGHLPAVRQQLEEAHASLLAEARDGIDPMQDLRELIASALCDEPPTNLREGGLLRDGYDVEADELRRLQRDARETLAALEARERQRTGISSLKVR
ncbi:MAG: DNA mismatch repair protein MutS, partial [Acidobacteria bacterium]|nr:DNA mismatch repair protein MutS [Acidobacteriota bacterium]